MHGFTTRNAWLTPGPTKKSDRSSNADLWVGRLPLQPPKRNVAPWRVSIETRQPQPKLNQRKMSVNQRLKKIQSTISFPQSGTPGTGDGERIPPHFGRLPEDVSGSDAEANRLCVCKLGVLPGLANDNRHLHGLPWPSPSDGSLAVYERQLGQAGRRAGVLLRALRG
jgi:hypothetical protein